MCAPFRLAESSSQFATVKEGCFYHPWYISTTSIFPSLELHSDRVVAKFRNNTLCVIAKFRNDTFLKQLWVVSGDSVPTVVASN